MKWCLRLRRAIGPVEGHITNLWKRRSAIQILRHRSRKLLPYALSMGQRCHGLDQQRSFGQQHLFQRPQRMAHPIGRTGILWRDRLHWYFYHNPYGSAKKLSQSPECLAVFLGLTGYLICSLFTFQHVLSTPFVFALLGMAEGVLCKVILIKS